MDGSGDRRALLLLLFIYSSTAQEIIINDHPTGDQQPARSTGSANWLEGTYAGCSQSHGNSARNGLDFHHDGARNKGQVEATYEPNIPRCGCYDVYEWHPGGRDCANHMPQRVPITVHESCAAGSGLVQPMTVYVNHAMNGARWNHIGQFHFDTGVNRIVSSNRGTTDCAYTGACYWVADAIKLVYNSEACRTVGYSEPNSGVSIVNAFPSTANRTHATCSYHAVDEYGAPSADGCVPRVDSGFPGTEASDGSSCSGGANTRGGADINRYLLGACLAVCLFILIAWQIHTRRLVMRYERLKAIGRVVYMRPTCAPLASSSPLTLHTSPLTAHITPYSAHTAPHTTLTLSPLVFSLLSYAGPSRSTSSTPTASP